jgi:hypothetical protein
MKHIKNKFSGNFFKEVSEDGRIVEAESIKDAKKFKPEEAEKFLLIHGEINFMAVNVK